MATLQQIIDAQKTVQQGGNGDWLYYITNPDTGKRELAYRGFSTGTPERGDVEGGVSPASPDYMELVVPQSLALQVQNASKSKAWHEEPASSIVPGLKSLLPAIGPAELDHGKDGFNLSNFFAETVLPAAAMAAIGNVSGGFGLSEMFGGGGSSSGGLGGMGSATGSVIGPAEAAAQGVQIGAVPPGYLSGPTLSGVASGAGPFVPTSLLGPGAAGAVSSGLGKLLGPATTGAGSAAGSAVGSAAGSAAGGAASGLGSLLGGAGGLAALGGAAGLLGASKEAGTTTTVQDIPAWLKPYATGLIDSAQGQFQASQTPNPLIGQAQAEMEKTIGGGYLMPESNPYLRSTYDQAAKAVTDNYTSAVQPRNDALFAKAGAFGPANSAYRETVARNQFGLGENLGNLANNLYGGNYNTERNRQFGATTAGPDFATSATGSGFAPFNQYASLLKGWGSQTSQPFYENKMGSALGGALTGYSIGSLFK